MNKRDQQLEAFIKQAERVAREWTIAEVEGTDTHPEYANKMFLIHELAKEVLNPEPQEQS